MNQEFTIKKVGGSETIGDIFQEIRRRDLLSLEEAAAKLRMQTKYLRALEQGNYKELPADVYIRGFIKSYSEYLGLNPEAMLKLYKTERNIIDNIDKKSKGNKHETIETKKSRMIITPQLAKIVLVFIIITGIFLYLWYQISGLSAAPKLAVTEPLVDKTIAEDAMVIVGQTKAGADVTINGQSVYVDTEGNFKESVALQEGLNSIVIIASNKLDKKNIVERKIMVERSGEEPNKSASDDDDEDEPKTAIKELELVLKIKDYATWVHVEEDGKIAYSGTMLPDSEQTFRAKENITLSSGKASSTYVIFNGKDIGALGESAEAIREMKFTKDILL